MCLCSCCVCFFCCFSSLLLFLCSWGPISWGLSNSAVHGCGQNALKTRQTDRRSDRSWNWRSSSSVWSRVLKWFKHVQTEGFEVNKIQVFLWQHLFCVDSYLSLCSFSLQLILFIISFHIMLVWGSLADELLTHWQCWSNSGEGGNRWMSLFPKLLEELYFIPAPPAVLLLLLLLLLLPSALRSLCVWLLANKPSAVLWHQIM